MAAKQKTPARSLGPIKIDRVFLYEENPRHEPIESEPDVIAHLCKDEQVLNLAKSIAEARDNPLELIGLVQISGSGLDGEVKSYQVWEGNRRVCAIKLLNDPDLAPSHLRKDFSRLAAGSIHVPIDEVNAVVFDDHDDLRYWMGIIHGGAQAGVGRLDWDAQQKERHFGSGRNRVALAVLDAAEALGMISKEEREGKLTTAQRFLNSAIVREAIGIDVGNKDDVAYTRPVSELKKQLGKFIGDLKRGVKVTSRNNRAQIDAYGRKLAREPSISGERTQPLSLKSIAVSGEATKKKRSAARKKPKRRDHLEYNKELALAIDAVGSDKLESLYFSLYSVRLDAHVPLLTIGVWAFIETVTALAGRHADADFVAFFSTHKLGELGFGSSNKKVVPIRDAFQRIQRNGNATKHHEISATFDGKQLNNDLATVAPILVKTLEAVAVKK
ncbi:MAG: hypothetical protein NBV67_04570 [Tagaea sp.]|nr:hypothetical protein [Tagaea sp.]